MRSPILSRLLLILFFLAPLSAEPLSSWNEPTRSQILDFVQEVTDPTSPNFRPPEERVAAFDLDGTLWPEKPMQFMRYFACESVRAELKEHPEWREQEPFRAALETNTEVVGTLPHTELDQLVLEPFAGNTPQSREQEVTDWLRTARHPQFDRPFGALLYQPQLELIAYLKTQDFRVTILSTSDQAFVRSVAPMCLVPREHALGSLVRYAYDERGVVATEEYLMVAQGENKPVILQYFLGVPALLAVGNSDGDMELLHDTSRRGGLSMLIHHTDDKREFQYDRKAEKALEEASRQNWVVVDMKKDWGAVFTP